MDTYEAQVGRLDHARVLAAGASIRSSLFPVGVGISTPTAINYEPSNGTRYDLHFAPVGAFVSVGSEFVPPGLKDSSGNRDARWTLVAKSNGQTWAYPFLLAEGNPAFPGYIAQHTGMDFPDACAITALLRAIVGSPIDS